VVPPQSSRIPIQSTWAQQYWFPHNHPFVGHFHQRSLKQGKASNLGSKSSVCRVPQLPTTRLNGKRRASEQDVEGCHLFGIFMQQGLSK